MCGKDDLGIVLPAIVSPTLLSPAQGAGDRLAHHPVSPGPLGRGIVSPTTVFPGQLGRGGFVRRRLNFNDTPPTRGI